MSGSDSVGRRGHRLLWIYFWGYVASLFTPLVILAVFSFHRSGSLALPWQGFSLRWYRTALDSPELLAALGTSCIVALVTTAVATVLGVIAGVAVVRFQFPGRAALAALGVAPLAVPYLGLAVALLLSFVTLGIQPSTATIIVGHTVIAFPYVMLLVATRCAGLPDSIEEAAADLGAGWWGILWHVHLPAVRPAIIVGAVTAFQVSFDELYLAYFLSGFNPTLPVFFYSGLRRPEVIPPAMALSTVVALVLVIVLAITWVLMGRQLKSTSETEAL